MVTIAGHRSKTKETACHAQGLSPTAVSGIGFQANKLAPKTSLPREPLLWAAPAPGRQGARTNLPPPPTHTTFYSRAS